MPIAKRVKSLGHSIGFRSGISTVVARLQSWGRIIMYHGTLSRDQHLFADQIGYLSRRFRMVSLEHAAQQLSSGRLLQDNEMVLTFDDGLRNNLSVAYPVLKHFGAPATFFVCPGLIDSGSWMWTKEVRCRLRSLDQHLLQELARQLSCVGTGVEEIVEWMKTLPLGARRSAEALIGNASAQFQPTDRDHEAYDMMDWNDLRSLDPALITVGSHTVTHPILTALDDAEIEYEIVESRKRLERELGRAVKLFCYPNGSHHPKSCASVRRTYDAAVTAENGMLTPANSKDVHCLPRIGAAKDGALMAWRLHRPEA